MPVVGVVTPAHKGKRRFKDGELPQWLTMDELLNEALYADPKWSPWTYELIAAALGELQERGDSISTTALTGPCPRSTVLERREDYLVEMDDLWRAFRGTMIHYVLEGKARPNSIAEHRFFAPLYGDEVVSCSPDLVTPDTIYDYKNSAKMPRYDYMYDGHEEQLQLNRYIVNHASRVEKDDKEVWEFPFDYRTARFEHLVIEYMDLDGPKQLETIESVQVPKKTGPGTKSKRVPSVWSDERVELLLYPRYKALRRALNSYPKWPAGVEELWGGPPEWRCYGYPYCPLRGKCLASRYPYGLIW